MPIAYNACVTVIVETRTLEPKLPIILEIGTMAAVCQFPEGMARKDVVSVLLD